ncbi:hypothetical protein Nepgr_004727 [Nepenthes gracilis]|uniref:Uncharacterized protein n=1 Tax=Nepenthes gracilis TaxID=150966 RepID=A0AAD3S1T3_NEPGR|nr:hypothetical protein Nepgr_004727 [Nepenthes gracilis]
MTNRRHLNFSLVSPSLSWFISPTSSRDHPATTLQPTQVLCPCVPVTLPVLRGSDFVLPLGNIGRVNELCVPISKVDLAHSRLPQLLDILPHENSFVFNRYGVEPKRLKGEAGVKRASISGQMGT